MKRRLTSSESTQHPADTNELGDYTQVSAASPSFYTELSLDPPARGSKGDGGYESVDSVSSEPAQYETLDAPDTADPEHVYSKVNNL